MVSVFDRELEDALFYTVSWTDTSTRRLISTKGFGFRRHSRSIVCACRRGGLTFRGGEGESVWRPLPHHVVRELISWRPPQGGKGARTNALAALVSRCMQSLFCTDKGRKHKTRRIDKLEI